MRQYKKEMSQTELWYNYTMWQGVVLEESLEDKSMLNMVRIVGTNVSKLEKENRVMTFHKVEIPDSMKDEYIERTKTNIKQGFYTHLE